MSIPLRMRGILWHKHVCERGKIAVFCDYETISKFFVVNIWCEIENWEVKLKYALPASSFTAAWHSWSNTKSQKRFKWYHLYQYSLLSTLVVKWTQVKELILETKLPPWTAARRPLLSWENNWQWQLEWNSPTDFPCTLRSFSAVVSFSFSVTEVVGATQIERRKSFPLSPSPSFHGSSTCWKLFSSARILCCYSFCVGDVSFIITKIDHYCQNAKMLTN